MQVPEPQVVSISELPPEARKPLELGPDLDAWCTSELPPPIAATTEIVEEWVQNEITELVNSSGKILAEIGESILWREVRKGKSGGPSTREEHFHGRVRYVSVENDEIFLFLDGEAVKLVRKIHVSYMEIPIERWLCAAGSHLPRGHNPSQLHRNGSMPNLHHAGGSLHLK